MMKVYPIRPVVADAAAAIDAQVLPVPAAVHQVDGVLRLLVDAMVRTAHRPQPFLSLGAALCAVGVLAGRRYCTETNLRTNLYVAAIADSGSGKDHPTEVVRQAFADAGLERYLGGENIASGPAVLTSLQLHPARLFQIDEMGVFLGNVTGKKAPPHKVEIWSELMKLYSRAKGTYLGAEYADQKAKARIDLQQPCACLYGSTTPSTFWRSLEGGTKLDGSLARFLVFITDTNYPERVKRPGIFRTSPELMEALQSVAAGAKGHDSGGNLSEAMTAQADPVPFMVPMTPEAQQLHDHQYDLQDLWGRSVAGTDQSAIVNRIGENAAKLALIRAVSRHPGQPKISRSDIEWGWLLSNHCARTLLREADRFISDNETEAKHKKVLEVVRSAGRISRSLLCRRTQYLSPRERDDVLRTLIEGGQLSAEQVPSKTKPAIFYRAMVG